jgi:DNA-binding HxlR family transcriptional regulator
MREKKWAGVYKAEIAEVLHDIPKGLRWSEIFSRINKNRAAQSKVPMSANTLQKYLDILVAEGVITKTALSHNNVVYAPTPKMDSIHTRFMVGMNICAALMLFGETETTVLEGVQHANNKEMKTASAFLREAADLIDRRKL